MYLPLLGTFAEKQLMIVCVSGIRADPYLE